MFFTRRVHHQITTDNHSTKFALFNWIFSCCKWHSGVDDYWENCSTGQRYYNYSINDTGMALSGSDTMWFDQSI